jgi:hypothetical protein
MLRCLFIGHYYVLMPTAQWSGRRRVFCKRCIQCGKEKTI